MKEMPGLTYHDIKWKIPFAVLLRMYTDLPRQKMIPSASENRNKTTKLTAETSDKFKDFIARKNAEMKSKKKN